MAWPFQRLSGNSKSFFWWGSSEECQGASRQRQAFHVTLRALGGWKRWKAAKMFYRGKQVDLTCVFQATLGRSK